MATQLGIYTSNFQGPDQEPFMAGRQNRLMRHGPPHLIRTSVDLLGPAQGQPMGTVIMLLGKFGDVEEGLAGAKVTNSGERKPRGCKNWNGGVRKKINRRQMFTTLLKSG